MVSQGLQDAIQDKAIDFIKKYTGSSYNYIEPTGNINPNYQNIGEILGIPVWVDTGARYSQEILDLPSLGDVLESIANAGINFEVKQGDCTICLVITFAIPLIVYPPIVICLGKKECEPEPEPEPEPERTCIPVEEIIQAQADIDNWVRENRNNDDVEPPFELIARLQRLRDSGLPVCQPRRPSQYPAPPPPGRFPGNPGECWSYRGRVDCVYPPNTIGGWGSICAGDPWNFSYGPGQNTINVYFAQWSALHWDFSFNVGISGGGFTGGYGAAINYNWYSSTFASGSWSGACWHWFEFVPVPGTTRQPPIEDPGGGTPPSLPVPPRVPSPPPAIPRPPRRDRDMQCCDDLKRILVRIEKVLKEVRTVLNPEQFQKKEVQIPKNWIYPTNNTDPVIMEDYADLISSVARLVDRRIGYLPQLVRIKDANPTQQGDQEMNLVVNSLADFSRLTLEHLLQANGDLGAVQMMAAANLYEIGITHQIAVSAWAELQAISEFLDYDTAQKREIFKMAFNPKIKVDENRPETLDKLLPKFLEPTKQEVEINQFKGGKTLKDIVMDIKRDTAAAAAATTRKLSEHSLDDVIEEAQSIERLKRLLLVKELMDREGSYDLSEFLKDAEEQYPSTESPTGRHRKPYGFEIQSKPKMRVTSKKSKKNKYKKQTQQGN